MRHKVLAPVMALLLVVPMTLVQPVAPAHAAERHFVQIVTKGAPNWSASMRIGGTELSWHHHGWGGKKTWWWTWYGRPNEFVRLQVNERTWWWLPINRDFCVKIDPLGRIVRAGSNGCTPA